MSLFNRQSDNTDHTTTGATGRGPVSADPTSGFDQSAFNNDPMDNRAGAQHGTQFREPGMGMGGLGQGNYVPNSSNDPTYNTATNTEGNFPRDTEGPLAGDAAGSLANPTNRHHHLHNSADPINNAGYTDQNQGYGNDTSNNANFGNTQSGNARRDLEGVAAGGAVGAVGVHEYEKHHHQGRDGMGTYQNDPTNVEGDATRGGQYGGAALGSSQYDSSSNQYDTNNPTSNQYGSADPTTAGGTNDFSDSNYTSNPNDNTNTGDYNTGNAVGSGNYGSSNTTGRTPGTTSNQNPEKDGKHLERSGKVDKIIGTLIGSDKMKEQGRQKQAEGAALRQDGNSSYDNTANNQTYD